MNPLIVHDFVLSACNLGRMYCPGNDTLWITLLFVLLRAITLFRSVSSDALLNEIYWIEKRTLQDSRD